MNVKKSFTLSDRSLQLAEKLVEDGQFPSIEKVLEAGIERLMWSEDTALHDVVTARADEIRKRMELPADQWISMEDDNMFERAKARLDERYKDR